MLQAARASLRIIDADPAAWRRRIVLAADVSDAAVRVRDDLDDGAIQVFAARGVDLRSPQDTSTIVDAQETVALAASAMVPADLGDASAQDLVDDAEGNELSWYATQEMPMLLDLD